MEHHPNGVVIRFTVSDSICAILSPADSAALVMLARTIILKQVSRPQDEIYSSRFEKSCG